MTEERLKAIELLLSNGFEVPSSVTQELIDEVRFLKAALADARKEADGNPEHDLQVGFGPGGAGHVTSPR